jgi:hypothetical protein
VNGFLHNLIARARAEADPVRPRVPSMFESSASTAGTLDEGSAEIPATPRRPEPATREPGELRAYASETPQPAGLVISPATPGLKTALQEGAPPAAWPMHAARSPAAPSGSHVETVSERTVVSSQVQTLEIRPAADAYNSISSSREPRESAVETKPRAAGTPPVPKSSSHEMSQKQSAVPTQARPPVAQGVPGRRAVREAPRREPESTTVHVNIGRIEIRAAHEPGGRPRSERTVPVMTLDDYLKNRTR